MSHRPQANNAVNRTSLRAAGYLKRYVSKGKQWHSVEKLQFILQMEHHQEYVMLKLQTGLVRL